MLQLDENLQPNGSHSNIGPRGYFDFTWLKIAMWPEGTIFYWWTLCNMEMLVYILVVQCNVAKKGWCSDLGTFNADGKYYTFIHFYLIKPLLFFYQRGHWRRTMDIQMISWNSVGSWVHFELIWIGQNIMKCKKRGTTFTLIII